MSTHLYDTHLTVKRHEPILRQSLLERSFVRPAYNFQNLYTCGKPTRYATGINVFTRVS